MDLTKAEMEISRKIGHAMILPLCVGFATIPVWMFAVQRPHGVAALLGMAAVDASLLVNATGGSPAVHGGALSWVPFL